MTDSPRSRSPHGDAPAPGDLMLRLTGEITTKGRRTRSRFQRRLADNLRDALRAAGTPGLVRADWSRVFVRADSAATDVLSRVFGVSTYSPLEAECDAVLEEIVRTGSRVFGERVKGRRFAVRARRAGKHGFSSQDVMRELGAAIGTGATVDLSSPEVEVCVDIRDERALLYSERLQGAGGLPLGTEGKAVCLLSGGFDSAVAAWMMLRRGVALDYVFCNLGGEAYQRMVLEVAEVLARDWSYGYSPTLFSLDFEPAVEEVRRVFRPQFQQLGLKRQMYRAASEIGLRVGAHAVITGEAVGQVSSQTLASLRAIDDASRLPVLRPLVGMDKEEIISRSRAVGTCELSGRVREYCSISSGRPATAASKDAVLRDDQGLSPEILDTAVDGARLFDLRSLDMSRIAGESVFVTDVPNGALVFDTRAPEAFLDWHWSGSRNREYPALLATYRELSREATYLLYCEHGLKSARLAELMQRAGFEAYSLMGGVKALRKLSCRKDPEGEPAATRGDSQGDGGRR